MTAAVRAWLGFLGVLVVAAVGVGAAGHLPAERRGGDEAVLGLWLGSAVSLLAAAAGSVPLARFLGGVLVDPSRVVVVVGQATLIRLAVTVALSGWLRAVAVVGMRPLLFAVAVSYVVLLAAETWWLLRSLRAQARGTQQSNE
jgi:hypothetical protein